MNDPLLMIKRTTEIPGGLLTARARDYPKVGYWYAGQSARGTGAIAQYQGYGEFTLGDGTVIDMSIYDFLEEHEPKAAKT